METNKNLTEKEQRVMSLIETENLSTSKLARRLKLSQGRVSQIKHSLEEKGYLGLNKNLNPMPMVMPSKYFRLHDLHVITKPYYFYDRFKKDIGKSYYYDKWHIFINTENIEFQTKKKASFDSIDIDECVRDFRASLERAIANVQDTAGCEILRDRRLNIKLVNQHIAEVNNGIAKLVKDKKLEITDENGEVWLVVDKSNKALELEEVHPIKAVDDAHKLEPHMNAMRKENSPTVIDLGKCIESTNLILQDTIKLIGFKSIKSTSKKDGKAGQFCESGRPFFYDHAPSGVGGNRVSRIMPSETSLDDGEGFGSPPSLPPLSILKSKVKSIQDILAPENAAEIKQLFSQFTEQDHEDFFEYVHDLEAQHV
jgi:hypothetical protein